MVWEIDTLCIECCQYAMYQLFSGRATTSRPHGAAGGFQMQLKPIPREERRFILEAGGRVCVGAHENQNGFIHWTLLKFSELPNDLVSRDDLVRAGLVHLLDSPPIAQG
jgi:hypothetical protein